jgi:hypothetical protein
MSPEELEKLLQNVPKTFRRNWILAKDKKDDENIKRHRMKMLAFKILMISSFIRNQVNSCACMLMSSSSDLGLWMRITNIDLLYGLGDFGCLVTGIYALGSTLCLLHMAMLENIGRKKDLGIIDKLINIKHLNLDEVERTKIARIPYFISIQRYLLIFGSTSEIQMFYVFGAFMSYLKFDSLLYAICAVPVVISYFPLNYNAMTLFLSAHQIIGMSATYFEIRLSRIVKQLVTFKRKLNSRGRKTSKSPQESKLEAGNLLSSAGKIMKELDEVLTEIESHNKTIKVILRDIFSCMGPMVSLVIVFFMKEMPLYVRMVTLSFATLGMMTAYSLRNASSLHPQLLQLGRHLHSCQGRLRCRGNHSTLRDKQHLLKLIHRLSSYRLPIGFTVGDTGSFTPESAMSFISAIVSISLIFLNTNK